MAVGNNQQVKQMIPRMNTTRRHNLIPITDQRTEGQLPPNWEDADVERGGVKRKFDEGGMDVRRKKK